jgi:hypothetical protein
VLAIGDIWHSNTTATFPHYLPTSTVEIGGAYITWEQIIIMAVSLVASGVSPRRASCSRRASTIPGVEMTSPATSAMRSSTWPSTSSATSRDWR